MLKLADLIENADKDQFHLGCWFGQIDAETGEWDTGGKSSGEIGEYFSQEPNQLTCGTTACIAGWAVAMKYEFDEDLYIEDYVENEAKRYLDLTERQADRLFFAGYKSVWAQYQHEYNFNVVADIVEEDGFISKLQLDPSEWNVTNKDAAHMLRRIANGEIKL